MKKFLMILLCILLAGCAAVPKSGEGSFTDDLGRSVTVENPQRVACLTASFADIWCAAGGADTLIATTNATWTYFDLPISEDVVNLGGSKALDLEALAACAPDLVLASAGTDRNVELEDTLELLGMNTAYFSVNSFDDYLRMLKICTDLTGRGDLYEQNGAAVAERVEKALARPDGSEPSVLFIRATGSGCKVKNSEDSVLGEMLAALGCRNIADGGALESLSMEAVLAEDPDHIFVVMQTADGQAVLEETLLNDPAWQSLTAVQEGRYHVMDPALYNLKPNARWGEAYEILADILYP